MGKLADMVAEQTSLRHRIKYNVRRFRMAGIGLFSKVDAERTRLYKQLLEASDQRAVDAGLLRRVNALSLGAINLMWEEGQKVFDDLVAAGEQAATRPRRASSLRGLETEPSVSSTPSVQAVAAAPAKSVATKPATKNGKSTSPARSSAAAVNAVLTTPANVKHLDTARKRTTALPPGTELPAFDLAVQRVEQLSERPDQVTQLALYALYKQATEGDVKGRRPAVAKVVERAKFDARRERKGMSPEAARHAYCQLVTDLIGHDPT